MPPLYPPGTLQAGVPDTGQGFWEIEKQRTGGGGRWGSTHHDLGRYSHIAMNLAPIRSEVRNQPSSLRRRDVFDYSNDG